ncbi:hypothetical protein RJ639_047589 [Escallonia herrerae]|uniref:Nitrate regulatory gene2 protein n=1 Tax=Escallonia herrerae TaxID=1293975 RepID=A0AA88W7K9_9ASTE|nr:hypothetical protein RJ639_047589 [Escallonia herrerae]
MGCVASRIDKEERVRICKERKRLMKQLVGFRGQFAEAQLAYLMALKNTGVTLRQFTESESLELEDTLFRSVLPPPLPPPPPPSPPPPPTFSPDSRKFENKQKLKAAQEEIIELDEGNSCTPPPPPVPSSSWDFWDPFGNSSPQCQKRSETVDQDEEENWAETNTEFEDEEQEAEVVTSNAVSLLPEKRQNLELVDDNSSMTSWHTKDTTDMTMVVWRSKKTLNSIIKELDDYFLKASARGRDVGVLMDVNVVEAFLSQNVKENKSKSSVLDFIATIEAERGLVQGPWAGASLELEAPAIEGKRYSSAKVFNALTWSKSSRSLRFTRDPVELSGNTQPCRPGAHCVTLGKLWAEEQRLYDEVKDEEIAKVEYEKKSLILQKLEEEDYDCTKTDKTRSLVESLQSDIICLQQSISSTCSSILKLIDEELHPQLTELTSGLMHMWRKMYECHQVQNHISQQVSHLTNQQSIDPTTNYHRQAAAQLKTEVTSWYNSFCRLTKSQRDYVRALCSWIQLTNCLVDDCQRTSSSSAVHTLCEEWQLSLEKLPDKVAAEGIKSLLSAIKSILLQQEEELHLQKRSEKFERKYQRELNSLAEMEIKSEGSFAVEDELSVLSAKHPLSVKRAKIEALKKQVDDEKAKYLNSIEVTRAMTLNNLQTSLPNVFRALMGFSSAYAQAFEAFNIRAKSADHQEAM